MIDEYTKSAGFVAEAFYVKGSAFARLGDIENAMQQFNELEQLSTKVQKVRALEIKIFSKALKHEIDTAKSKMSTNNPT